MDEKSSVTDNATLHEESITIEEKKNSITERSNDEIKKSIDAVNVQLSKTKFFLVILALIVSLTMSSLDISIVSTALPTISNQFDSKDEYTWVITAYMLGNTSFQPMFGKFSDIFGRRPVMIFALVLFVITSALCGAAHNIKMLIVARGFQGIAGGGILAMTNIIIADIVPLRKRGLFMGINGAIFSFSSVVGPLLGGFFTDNLTWRWSFYINVPIGIVCLILIIIFFKMPKEKGSLLEKIKRIDFSGTFSIIGSLVCILLALNWGGQKYPWSSGIIISLLSVGTVLLIIYIIIECKFAKEPITPPELFKYRNITAPCLTSFFNGTAFLTCVNTLPLLYQDGRGLSATIAGLRMTPASFCITISAITSGYTIGKWGHIDKYIKSGSFFMIFSTFCMTLIDVDTPYYKEVIYFIFFGLTVGLIFQNCIMVAQQISPPEYLAISTTLISFFNTIGAVVGVAIHGALLQNFYPSLYKEHYPQAKPITVNDVHNVDNGPAIYVEALRKTYRYTIVPAAVIVFICAMFIKNYSMKSSSQSSKNPSSKDTSDDVTITFDDRSSTEIIKVN